MESTTENEGRRGKLVRAASQVIHRQGYMRTTLADIAQAADVALGSVYYYFKSKDDIVKAISERRLAHLDHILIRAAETTDPLGQLHALIQLWVSDKEIDAMYGCPIGSLCYELAKQRGNLSDEASKPLRVLLRWAEEQFRLLGKGGASSSLALHLISTLQGAGLVANAFNDPAVIVQETDHLKVWLQEVVSTATGARPH